MSDERLIECDSFEQMPRYSKEDINLVQGQIYQTDLYKDTPCVFLGREVKGKKLGRHLIYFSNMQLLAFGDYEINGNKIRVLDRPTSRNVGPSEIKYLANLLERKLAKSSK